MKTLASTPLVMTSAGFDKVGQNLHALGELISDIVNESYSVSDKLLL